MTLRTCVQGVRCARRAILWLGVLGLLLPASLAWTAAVGDQVELQARNRAGVPLHQELRGTALQRVPHGTKATVTEVAQDGRWLRLALPGGRTGWVTSRYLSDRAPDPSIGTSRTGKTPLRTEEGHVERVSDGDTLTVITANQTKLRIRLLGIDAPETRKGTKFSGQPYGTDAEAYLKQLVESKRVRVDMYGVDRYKRLLATIFVDGKDMNLAMIEAGLAEVYQGPASGNPYTPQYQAAEAAAGGGSGRTRREERHVESGRWL